MAKKESKNKNAGGGSIFSVELAGMLLALFSSLSLLCLITGDSVFEKPGLAVQNFFLGAAGYFAFPALLFLLWSGVKMIIGIKTKGTAFRRFSLIAFFYLFSVFAIWHTAFTANSFGGGLSAYVDACYVAGGGQTTPGGGLFALICYFPSAWLTVTGAYVLYGLAVCVFSAFVLKNKIADFSGNVSARREKKREEKERKQNLKNDISRRGNARGENDSFGERTFAGDRNSRADGYADYDEQSLGGRAARGFSRQSSEFDGGLSPENGFDEEKAIRKNTVLQTVYAKEKFGLKSKREIKKNSDKERSLKILFGDENSATSFGGGYEEIGGGTFSQKYARSYSSYQNDYDNDMAAKTDYVRRPVQPDFRSPVQSPMGADLPESVAMRNSFSREDGSLPDRETYVISDGKNRESVSAFDRRRGDRFERMRSENEPLPYNYSESYDGFSDRYSANSAGYSNIDERRNSNGYSLDSGEDRYSGDGRFSRAEEFVRSGTFGSPAIGGSGESERVDESYTRGEIDSRGGDIRSGRGVAAADDNLSISGLGGERTLNEIPTERKITSEVNDGVEVEELFSSRRDNALDDEPKSPGIEALKRVSVVKGAESDESARLTEKNPPFIAATSHFSQSASTTEAFEAPKATSEPAAYTRPTSASQLKMADVPEGNRLENPIENIPANYRYRFAPFNLMNDYRPDAAAVQATKREQESRKETILSVLKNGNIDAQIVDVKYGPALTRFELTIPTSTSIKRVLERQDDLNLWLAAKGKIRIVAPITGTSRIGIEVPNSTPQTVGLKELVTADAFKNAKKSSLTFCLGKDLVGNPVNLDLTKMPHLLVAGATGTGKSVFLNTLLISLMYKYTPEELRIILVDPKIVEFSLFKGTPNLLFDEIITETRKACAMLDWACKEMDDRYLKLHDVLVKNVDEYNAYVAERGGKPMYKILIIIDEFADLMATASDKKNIENKIGRIAAKARAAGIHLIMATQRPSVDIMEGSIKTNFTSRIAFKMSSPTDAQVIMGEIGAEKLLGRGDVLYRTSTMMGTERAQGAFIDTPEIDRICKYLSEHNKCYYNEAALDEITKNCEKEDATAANATDVLGGETTANPPRNDEEIVKNAMRLAIAANNISITMMQRRLGLGYPKAGKIMDILVDRNYVGTSLDSRHREIKMNKEEFEKVFGEPFDVSASR